MNLESSVDKQPIVSCEKFTSNDNVDKNEYKINIVNNVKNSEYDTN